MNSNDTELMKQVVHTHRTSCWSSWPREFGELIPSPHSWIFTSVSVDFIPRSYLLTSAMVRIAVNFAPNCGTEPIRYVTLHLGDRRVAAFAPLQKSNQKHSSYVWTESLSGMVWFRAGAWTIREKCEQSLRLIALSIHWQLRMNPDD